MSTQTRMIVAALLVIAAIAGGWVGVIAPKRSDAAALQGRIAAAQMRLDAATATATTADHARDGYRADYATLAKFGKAVPDDDDVASLVYQLESIARRNKIDFRAVKLTAVGAAATQPTAPTAPAAPAAADAGAKAGAGSTGPTGTQPAAPAVVSQAPPGTVVGTAGLMTVPFTFTFDGGYLAMRRFLKAIDGLATSKQGDIRVNGRLLTVDGFSLTPGLGGLPKLKAVVSATAYLVPANTAAAGATAQAPGGTTAPDPTTTSLKPATAQGDGR